MQLANSGEDSETGHIKITDKDNEQVIVKLDTQRTVEIDIRNEAELDEFQDEYYETSDWEKAIESI